MTRYSNCTVLSGLKLTNIIRVDNLMTLKTKATLPIGNAISSKSSVTLQGAERLFAKMKGDISRRAIHLVWFCLNWADLLLVVSSLSTQQMRLVALTCNRTPNMFGQ